MESNSNSTSTLWTSILDMQTRSVQTLGVVLRDSTHTGKIQHRLTANVVSLSTAASLSQF